MKDVNDLIDFLITLQGNYTNAPEYIRRITSYEIDFFTKDCRKCHQQSQNLIENASKSLDMCLKVKEFILEVIIDFSFIGVFYDGSPLPTLKNMDQVKENYEGGIAYVMLLNRLNKDVIKYFVATPPQKCEKIQEEVTYIQYIIEKSLQKKVNIPKHLGVM